MSLVVFFLLTLTNYLTNKLAFKEPGGSLPHLRKSLTKKRGTKGDSDFRISDLVKNRDGTDI